MISGPPVLGLKMKNLGNCSVESPTTSMDLVEKVQVMASQDDSCYKCTDYLSRRSARNGSAKPQQIDDEDDCPTLMAEDSVDAVCREKMCEYFSGVLDLEL